MATFDKQQDTSDLIALREKTLKYAFLVKSLDELKARMAQDVDCSVEEFTGYLSQFRDIITLNTDISDSDRIDVAYHINKMIVHLKRPIINKEEVIRHFTLMWDILLRNMIITVQDIEKIEKELDSWVKDE